MKKFITDIRTLAALLMAGAAFTACSSSDDNIIEQPQNPTEPKVYTLVIKASKGGDATTRALQLDGSTLNAYWSGDETIEVGQAGKKIGTAAAAPSADGTTTITATLTQKPTTASDIEFYLCSGNLDYTGQVGLLTDDVNKKGISEKYDYTWANLYTGNFEVNGYNVNLTNDTYVLDFVNDDGYGTKGNVGQAIVKFTLVDKGNSDAPINAISLTIHDSEGTLIQSDNKIGWGGPTFGDVTISPAGTTNVIYAALAGVSGSNLTLTATDGTDTYTYSKSNVTFNRGQYYEITVKMTKQAPTDLSMVDCAGNARNNGMWTANCYMVHTAGKYKLPLVYGNAIKDGADNTAAYNPGEMTTSNPYCANFVNHNGDGITDPWIKNNGITVESAELLWQDATGLVTAVGIDGDYLTLTVGKNAAAQEGNAVVAAKDGDGTIVWSWHIWVTKQTFATLTEVNTGSHTYSVTPVNLGWVGDAISATGYQTYYQWGRKDAFIPGTGTGNTNHTVYDINGAEVTEGLTYVTSNPAVTIADNIKNPTTFYRVGDTDRDKPSTAEFFNLWDAQQTEKSDNIATATVKTIYDPSPAGFCVPTGNLYKYISDVNKVVFTWDDANKGRNLPLPSSTSNVFFPASGYRARGSGSITNDNTEGYYWSASACYGYSGYYFKFTSSTRNWHNSYRANGFSVRAVAEE